MLCILQNYIVFFLKARKLTVTLWILLLCCLLPSSIFSEVTLVDFHMKLSGDSFVKNEIFFLRVECKGYHQGESSAKQTLSIPKKLSSKDITLTNVKIIHSLTGIELANSSSGRQGFHIILEFYFKGESTGNLEIPILPIAFENEEPFLFTPRMDVRIVESRFVDYQYLFWTVFGCIVLVFIYVWLKYKTGKLSNYLEIKTYRRFLKLKEHTLTKASLRKLLTEYLSVKFRLSVNLKKMLHEGDLDILPLEGDIQTKLKSILSLSEEAIARASFNLSLEEKMKTILFLIHDKNKELPNESRYSEHPTATGRDKA